MHTMRLMTSTAYAVAARIPGAPLRPSRRPHRQHRHLAPTAAAGPNPAAAAIMDASRAFMRTATLYSATKLGVADALAAGPMPVAELASTVGAKPDYLRRVLRFLAVIGVFEEPSPGVFANNAASELLQRGKPGGMSDMVLHVSGAGCWGRCSQPRRCDASGLHRSRKKHPLPS